MTPPALDHIVNRCLAKDSDDRFDTAHDVMLELQWIAEGGSQTARSTKVARQFSALGNCAVDSRNWLYLVVLHPRNL